MKIRGMLAGASALAIAFAASQQTQAVVTNVKSIQLVQNLNETFQIAEIQAFETGSGINKALSSNGGVASASSSGFGTNPTLVNDNNLAGNHPNEWHSNDAAGAFIRVDLAAPTSIDSVSVFGRTDCCQNRQDDFNLIMRNAANQVVFFQRVQGLGTSPGATGNIVTNSSGPILGLPVNAALGGKTATQSSEFPGFPASNAVDGNLGNFTHTNSNDSNASWQVDLGATMPINQIILNNRANCCQERLRDINVDILDRNGNVVQSFVDLNNANILGSPSALTINLPNTVLGRTVRVSRTADAGGGDANNVLSLGEAQVIANNLALFGTATQSSDHGAFPASNAIDNNLGNFSHTNGGVPNPVFNLDLNGTFAIDSIVLHNRDDCCGGRLRDITVQVLAGDGLTVLATALLNAGGVLGAPAFLAVDLHQLMGNAVNGRFVRVSRASLPGGGDDNNVLALGELQVFGRAASVPEPASAMMGLLGLVGLGIRGRRARA